MLKSGLLAASILLLLPVSSFANDVPASLSSKAKITVSSEETAKNNLLQHANDGNLKTRWCAASGKPPQWLQLELERPANVKFIRIHWESTKNPLKYKIEASADAETWKVIHDRSDPGAAESGKTLAVDAPETKFLRVTFLGSDHGSWASIREIEVSEQPLPELPKHPLPTIADVVAPGDFTTRLFGVPPLVNYPVCLTAGLNGEVYVGVDEQGSLGKEKGRGKILKLVDHDNDGHADSIQEFAKVDHPRGLLHHGKKLWVLHPPFLSLFHDDNDDGIADRQETLLTGISTADVSARGADHTTNGIQFGIDGWIYIAVGDYGVTDAKGTDGTEINQRGGGIIRVRPDGTEMEIYAWGLRNVLDACIDPLMNIYTRDNTNDGGEWDVRLSQIYQSANYGYPSLYMNFKEDIMPVLADYGGGSGCGGLYLNDGRWPQKYGNALYTADWGRSIVYLHHLTPNGPTHSVTQEEFVKIPRPTDVDVDGAGRMYISSWKNGMFNYDGPNVGFVAQLIPKGFEPAPVPKLDELSTSDCVAVLLALDAKHRQQAQFEILRRGRDAAASKSLEEIIFDKNQPIFGRVAALYTLKQLDGIQSHPVLVRAAKDVELQGAAIRALTDRKTEFSGVSFEVIAEGLSSTDQAVQAQALISLGRLGDMKAAAQILPFTKREDGKTATSQKHNEPDIDSVLPHLAVQSLVELNAADECLNALNGPYRDGALSALKQLHSRKVIDGLEQRANQVTDTDERLNIITALIRLYHQEGRYEKNWWGTRPDRTGPYYDRQKWAESDAVQKAIETQFDKADSAFKNRIIEQLTRHQVTLEHVNAHTAKMVAENDKPISLPKVDPNNPNQIANLSYEVARDRAMKTAGDAAKGSRLGEQQSCLACHTVAAGQAPKGPHLVDIGKRYSRAELIESILKPSAKIAQGFDTQVFATESGQVIVGFVTSEGAEDVHVRQNDGVQKVILQSDIDARTKQPQSMMPEGLVNNLTPEQLADLLAWLESLRS